MINKRIKILYILPYLYWGGGLQRNRLIILKHINKKKFAAEVCALEFKGHTGKLMEDLGFSVYCLKSPAKFVFPQTTFRLYRLIRKLQPDIVHTGNLDGDFHGVVAARLGRVPVVITEAIGGTVGRKMLTRKLDRIISMFADCVLAVSSAVKNDICEKEEVDKDKVIVTHNPLDISGFDDQKIDFSLRERYGIKNNEIVIGIVARLEVFKAHRYLIQSISQLVSQGVDRIRLLIVGDGPLQQELRQCVADEGIEEKVVFTGMVEDVASHLRLMDIFAHPSLWEPFGISILEAMYMGLPVVSTAVGGVPDYIDSGRNGLLVPPADSRALAAAIKKLVDSAELRRKLGNNAKNAVVERFLPEAYVHRLESIYEELMTRKIRKIV